MEIRYKEVYIKIDPATIMVVIYVIEILTGYSYAVNLTPFL